MFLPLNIEKQLLFSIWFTQSRGTVACRDEHSIAAESRSQCFKLDLKGASALDRNQTGLYTTSLYEEPRLKVPAPLSLNRYVGCVSLKDKAKVS